MPDPLTPRCRVGSKDNLRVKTEENGIGENSIAHNAIWGVWSLHGILHGIALCLCLHDRNGLVHPCGIVRRAQQSEANAKVSWMWRRGPALPVVPGNLAQMLSQLALVFLCS